MTQLATIEQLPPLLRDPPWTSGERAAAPPHLALPPLDRPARLVRSSLNEQMLRNAGASWLWQRTAMSPQAEEQFLDQVGIRPEARPRLRTGAALRAGDFVEPAPTAAVSLFHLLNLPDAMALSLWNGVPAQRWQTDWEQVLSVLFMRHAEPAAPALVAYAARRPVQSLRVGRCLDSTGLAAVALEARRRLKIAQKVAAEWLLTHPDTAALVLLHQLFGSDDARREDARAALHDLALKDLRPSLQRAAAALGSAAAEGLREQLDADPLLHLPARMPKLPPFFDPFALHRPRLAASGTALPDDAIRNLGLMLAISKRGQPYAGLDAVRAACSADSLAEFVWTLFEAWWAAEAPSKEAWCFEALAVFGNDSTAHKLGARTMRMARDGAKNRAQAAVDMLAHFGSDPALMHLNDLAERCKVVVVRNRAAARIDAVAQERGLSRIQLADRLVPTLGLEESRTLDFGPRRFEIGFDETLTPFVRDAEGARLQDLPKPRRSDDAVMAEAASLRWKQLKTEMKSLARVQIARMEQAMIGQRRWLVDDFDSFFVAHPLMREVAARLLWAVFDAQGRVVDAFRVAEDGTLADAQDHAYRLSADVHVGIAHPLTLPLPLADAFKLQFADYEVLQPFAQLTREVFVLAPAEAAQSNLDRFDGQDVATGAVIGLLDRGWLRGRPQDGGMIQWIDRPVGSGPGLVARLQLVPGMFVGQLSAEPRQTLGTLGVFDTRDKVKPFDPDKPTRFDRADAIAISEALRDLHRIAPSSLRTP